jgi:succinoglycan biosynthesis protein ExoM
MKLVQPRILIAVCTCQREAQLAICLNSIVRQALPLDWTVELLVVENGAAGNALSIVNEARKTAAFEILYEQEALLGIPFARNRALEIANSRDCDWMIFIDDDEIADDDWLLNYAGALKNYPADVIHGKVIYQFPASDNWAHLLERNASNDKRIDGKVVHSAATNNVMFSARLFASNQMALSFDTALRFSGGSDTEFFNRARRAGAKIVYSAKPVVYETVPMERCTLKRLMQRDARVTAAAVYIDALHYGKSRAVLKHAKRGVQNFIQGCGYFVVSMGCCLLDRVEVRKNFLKSCLRFSRCYGRILGMSGRLLSPYKTIDRAA